MMMSLRKFWRETSAPSPAPKFHTLLAHRSNSRSWVTPRSSVMGSYLVRPGDLRPVDGSPPSRCSTTSVERLSEEHLHTPATYLPSHFTRNLKFLYGSKRCALTENWAMPVLLTVCGRASRVAGRASSGSRRNLAGDLLDADHHEFGRLERREADVDVDDAEVDVGLRRGLAVALDEIGFARRASLEGALAEETLQERADVETDLRPERLVVGLE